MPFSSAETDANFYRLVHSLKASFPGQAPAERREEPRGAFSTSQRIAPLRGDRLPDDSEFFEVLCRDLSKAGFSFLLPAAPDFTMLVAAFGTPPNMIYVAGEIVHCTNVLLHPSGLVEDADGHAADTAEHHADGRPLKPMALVGCRFTKRLKRPPAD
jgi:hypothetical protein